MFTQKIITNLASRKSF